MGQARIDQRNAKLSMFMPDGVRSNRASRFAKRANGEVLQPFSALSALPYWTLRMDDAAYRKNLARLAALLHFRPQIDREISGAKLQSLAEEFGEALLDTALAAELPSHLPVSDLPLPRPDKMEEIGMAMVENAMPQSLLVQTPAGNNAETSAILATAALLLESLPPEFSNPEYADVA
jgi:hypothetical protein